MTTIISFVNQKGGVGKTTSTINVAAALASKQYRVLIIDMDPQANTTQVYSTTTTDEDPSIYHLLLKKDPTDINLIKKTTYITKLDLIPSNVLLSSAELDLVTVPGRETVLKRLLKSYHTQLGTYDFILIDCQPSLGLLTINAMIASDHIMVPLHADVFSLTGLDLLLHTVEKLQTVFEINTTLLGFFFTQAHKQGSLFKEAVSLCSTTYPSLLFTTAISANIAIDHANATGQSVLDFDKQSSSAQDYLSLTTELLNKLEG